MNPPLTSRQQELIDEIKRMTYEDMVKHYRRTPMGHPYHTNEVGVFFRQRMDLLACHMTALEREEISARIGW